MQQVAQVMMVVTIGYGNELVIHKQNDSLRCALSFTVAPHQPMGSIGWMFRCNAICIIRQTVLRVFFFVFLCVDCQLAKLLCLPDGKYINHEEASTYGQKLWLEH